MTKEPRLDLFAIHEDSDLDYNEVLLYCNGKWEYSGITLSEEELHTSVILYVDKLFRGMKFFTRSLYDNYVINLVKTFNFNYAVTWEGSILEIQKIDNNDKREYILFDDNRTYMYSSYNLNFVLVDTFEDAEFLADIFKTFYWKLIATKIHEKKFQSSDAIPLDIIATAEKYLIINNQLYVEDNDILIDTNVNIFVERVNNFIYQFHIPEFDKIWHIFNAHGGFTTEYIHELEKMVLTKVGNYSTFNSTEDQNG